MPNIDVVETMEDQCVINSRRRISRERFIPDVHRLSKINNKKAAVIIVIQWCVIALAWSLAIISGHWMVYMIAMIVVASRQHALAVIMHDATHFRLFSTPWANEWISDLFCAMPIGLTTSGYRYQHLLHHRYINTEKDPYWVSYQKDDVWSWPKERKEFINILLKDFFCLSLKKNMGGILPWTWWPYLFGRGGKPGLTLEEHLRLLIFVLVVGAGIYFSGLWYAFLLLWVLPHLTILTVFGRIRAITEHLGLAQNDEFSDSRHVDGSILERMTVCPLSINVHVAHHLFPSVPLYNLRELHKILLQDEEYCKKAKCYPSYFGRREGALKELIQPSPV